MINYKDILLEAPETLLKLNVLFIGDSQTANPQSFAYDLLRDKIVTGKVIAQNGASTAWMYKTLRERFTTNYDVVVIMGGGNDSLNATPDKAINNLIKMYQFVQSNDSIVIAISNPTKAYTANPSKYPSNEKIADWVNTQDISNFTINGNRLTHNPTSFSKDRVHLNNAGHNILGDAVVSVLKNIASGATKQDTGVINFQRDLEKAGFELGLESQSGIIGTQTKNAVTKLNKLYKKQSKSQTISDKALSFIKSLLSSDVAKQNFDVDVEDDVEVFDKDGVNATNPEHQAMIFFKNQGLTTSQSAGIIGNLYIESNLDVNAVGDNGTSFGIAQWHNERYTSLKKWAAKNNLQWNSFNAQLKYLWWELNNTESNALLQLKQQHDPARAAYVFAKYFERPAEISSGRLTTARKVYDTFTKDIIKRLK